MRKKEGKSMAFIVVNEVFVVVVRSAGGRAVLLDFIAEKYATDVCYVVLAFLILSLEP